MKSCFADSICNAFWELMNNFIWIIFESVTCVMETFNSLTCVTSRHMFFHFVEIVIWGGLHATGTCVYKTEITPGSRKWGHLPTIGIPKAIYHYVTNTTKQQPTYQLFQNIMRPKNQLVNPPKMKKFHSICAFSRFLLQLWPLKLGQLANQSGSSHHMTCKMAGNGPSRQGSHGDIGLQEG